MRSLILILGFISLPTQVLSAPITFTGTELSTLPGASFPTGGNATVGDDLRFDPTLFGAVLYRLDLSDYVVDTNDIGFSLTFTRLLNDGGDLDQDISIGIYDGQTFFNAVFDGEPSDQARPQHRVDALNATETQLAPVTFLRFGAFTPSPGDSLVQLDVTLRATPSETTLISEVNSAGAISSTVSTVLQANSGLSLLIIGNETNENHLINSLTFTSGISLPTTVPEPGAMGGLALGLGMLGFSFYRRRFI